MLAQAISTDPTVIIAHALAALDGANILNSGTNEVRRGTVSSDVTNRRTHNRVGGHKDV